MRPRLVIADDHEILRDALCGHAARSSGFEVVAGVGDAQAAVNACARLQPDLLMLDNEMPGRDALAAIADVRSASPRTRIVILTAFCRDPFIEIAVASGVSGYLLKSDPPTAIFAALREVAGGGTAYSRPVTARMAQRTFVSGASSSPLGNLRNLTPREIEVLRYIGRGMDNVEMSRVMSLSKRTVERHVARLMDAVAIRDRAGLIRCAYDHGLVV